MNDKIFYIKHINKTFHKMEKMQRNLHNIAKNYFLLRKKLLLFATFKQNISKLEVIHLYKEPLSSILQSNTCIYTIYTGKFLIGNSTL